jgi:2-keto-4-pentenoate hydratase/2-oxohepta-3-ene-1,7-dioic acid hydratase in catechol pathway
MACGAVVVCATSITAQSSVKSPFQVAATYAPIVGCDEMFPVCRIYCVGRNFAAHAREMGSDPTREPPFFLQKPTDAIQYVPAGTVADHPYPSLTKIYHYEAELVAFLGIGGRHIPLDKALNRVYRYSLGLDMTRRDLKRALSDEKKPSEIGMLSQTFKLSPDDIIYSATPENVGPVVQGDVIEMHIDGLPNLSVKIV